MYCSVILFLKNNVNESGMVQGKIYSYYIYHYRDATWLLWHLKSLTTRLFIQQLIQASKKANIKARINVHLEKNLLVDVFLCCQPEQAKLNN